MGIVLDEARRMNIALPGLSLVHQLYQSVKALGYGRKGTQALMLALENMAGKGKEKTGEVRGKRKLFPYLSPFYTYPVLKHPVMCTAE